MSMESIYAIVSAILLLWVGCIWSSTGWSNIAVKTISVVTAFAGAVIVARAFGL